MLNLRRRAAETLENVSVASTSVQNAAAMQTIVLGMLCIGVMVAIGLGLKAIGNV